jgi:glycosyltransferase involved in cell wall biosynthesis
MGSSIAKPSDASTSTTSTDDCLTFETSLEGRQSAGERRVVDSRTLCLNMIVKNEMANLDRCLRAIAPHVGCWVIGDTGSTDGTQSFIKSFFAERGLPGELHEFPFVNFEQARNAALDCAYASPLPYDYLIFCDADMELVVEDPDFRSKLEAPGYSLLQKSGVSYWNTRLVRRDAGPRYRGVTHEYVDLSEEARRLSGVWYIDHASGSNRVDKFERDIRLLKEALKAEIGNHRYQFYLAQSLKDAGRTAEAAEAYAKRAGMGGWDEEAWYARLQQARCLRALKDEGGFVREALAAFNQRPHRAEPLYDLARFYREKGMNDASVLFAEAGLVIPPPQGDALFIEDFVYSFGFKEEFSIAANYARDAVRKDRGFAACNWLALSREAPDASRALARHNLRFYVQPADKMMPSFAASPVGFTPSDGDRAGNPSVASLGDEIRPPQPASSFALNDALASPAAIAAEEFRGGLQAIEFDGERLALVYEVLGSASDRNQVYHHRFVWLDAAGVLRGMSRPFFFQKHGVEFSAGLAWHPDGKRLMVSYGEDAEAWVATVDAADVRPLRGDADRLPSGDSGTESRSPPTRQQISQWVPSRPLAGTEIMVETLRQRLGSELDGINLQVNSYRQDERDKRPLVVWFHHDVNQAPVQWCKDTALTRQISRCVFVSDWQRERYIRVFGMQPERCVVLRNAVEMTANVRSWTRGLVWRCAYTSTPFRGLSVLLKAWRYLNPTNAELHIWSSMKLYHVGSDKEDRKYQHLYDLASTLPTVVYHGLSPNKELREALRDIHFLTYPNTFEETSCVAVIEAMAAGCRVIAPSFGALPETTAGYARLYPWNADENAHAAIFARVLASEMAQPWNGDPKLAEAEQHYSATAYDWKHRDYEWRRLIDKVLTCQS